MAERQGFTPLIARTEAIDRCLPPVAFDCVRLCFLRTGTAILFSEFGTQPATPSDVILLAAHTLCGCEPEEWVSMTTLYLDTDFLIDQVFWQYASVLPDRLAAQDFAHAPYAEPAQLLRLGEERGGHLTPWLDELTSLSVNAPAPARFFRQQALLFSILDVISPFISVSDVRITPTQRATRRPVVPRHRAFSPLREEARRAESLLRGSLAHPWTMKELAGYVHLSTSHLSKVFVDAFGKSPLAYLTMLRAEELARLLRATDMTVAAAGRMVGWRDPDYAGRQFRRCVGLTPRQYRLRSRKAPRRSQPDNTRTPDS